MAPPRSRIQALYTAWKQRKEVSIFMLPGGLCWMVKKKPVSGMKSHQTLRLRWSWILLRIFECRHTTSLIRYQPWLISRKSSVFSSLILVTHGKLFSSRSFRVLTWVFRVLVVSRYLGSSRTWGRIKRIGYLQLILEVFPVLRMCPSWDFKESQSLPLSLKC